MLVWTKPILKQLGFFSHPTGCLQNLDIFPYSKSHFQQTSTSLKKKPWVSALMGIIASYYSVFFPNYSPNLNKIGPSPAKDLSSLCPSKLVCCRALNLVHQLQHIYLDKSSSLNWPIEILYQSLKVLLQL